MSRDAALLAERNPALDRVERAAQALQAAREVVDDELARRDAIIVETHDSGSVSIRALAKAAGISVPGLYQVLARAS